MKRRNHYLADKGITFELNPGPQKDEDGKPLLYAIPEKNHKWTFRMVEEDSVSRMLAIPGEMKRSFEAFLEMAGLLLSRGYRVETPIGSFSPKLKLKGKFTDPEKVTGRDVEFAGIEFHPNKEFMSIAGSNPHRFEKKKQMVGNEAVKDEDAMLATLRKCLGRGYVTTTIFQARTGLKRDTARRFLDGLCEGEHPLLKLSREGSE